MFSNNPLLEHFEMFRVRHCRVTSLASGMLWMILPGPPTAPVKPALSKAEGRSLGWFEGHTVCDSPRPVNAQSRSALDQNRRSVLEQNQFSRRKDRARQGGTEVSPGRKSWVNPLYEWRAGFSRRHYSVGRCAGVFSKSERKITDEERHFP